MPFAAAFSTESNSTQAVEAITNQLKQQLADYSAEVMLIFYSSHHEPSASAMTKHLHGTFQPKALIGCMGESIIGNQRELEQQPALSVWVGSWKEQVEIESFHLVTTRTPDGVTLLGWPDGLFEANPEQTLLLTLGDPYTFPVNDLYLQRLNEDYPGVPVVGGMASGITQPGESILIHNQEIHSHGAVGILLRGPIRWRTIVSQGARPIGEPKIITRGEDNVIQELGGQPPLHYLRELFGQLTPRDQMLCRQGALMIGLAMSEYRDSFDRGDFLIRNLFRFDETSGALAITDRIRLGQTVQFQLRDADAADEDLYALLKNAKTNHWNPAAGLLFSCNGRGSRMFSLPDHDARAIQDVFNTIPLAGFFAAGELGPVAGKNYIHGFTASVIVFDEIGN